MIFLIDIEVKILSDRKVEIPYRRFGGTQGDTGYRVKFDVSNIHDENNIYRIEWFGAADSFTQTIPLVVTDGMVMCSVPKEISKAGGTAVAYLIEESVSDSVVAERICTYPIRLYFNNKPTGDNSVVVGEYERNVTDMYLAMVNAKTSLDRKATVVEKELEEAKEKYQNAANQLEGIQNVVGVRYDTAQELTDEQKAQARGNIGAAAQFGLTDEALEFIENEETGIPYLRIKTGTVFSNPQKSGALDVGLGNGLKESDTGNLVEVDENIVATKKDLNDHNVDTTAHNDIREVIQGLSDRIKALHDCDDTTLDQTKEIVAYIKANKSLIENVTTSKVNVSDIIDNLTTSVSNKPLSAKQGVMLKSLIDDIVSNYATKDDLKNIKIPDVNTFNYKKYDVPIVYINGDFDSIDEKSDIIKCDYSYENKGVTKTGYCTAKWQGSSSLNYPKKNFTIKFYNDADCTSKDKFEAKTGWGNEYKYCFKADWIDFSHSRNVVAAELWGSVVKSRKDVNTNGTISNILNQVPNGGAIDGFPIFLVINGEWQGIYNWNIPKDDWTLGMGKGVGQKEVILCASGNNSANFAKDAVIGTNFDLEYATDEKDADGNQKSETVTAIQNSLNNLIRLVKNSDGSNIDTEIAKYLDIQSAIDYFIFTVLTDNYDGILKNYLLGSYDYETEGGYGKWFFGAYDLDAVFGMTIDGKPTAEGLAYRPFTYGQAGVVASTHKLFNLLWTYKKEDVIARYRELLKNQMSLANVTTKFCNYMSKIPLIAYDEDAKMWTGILNTSTNNLTQIITWYENRLEVLNRDMLGDVNGETWAKIGSFTLTPQEVTVTSGQTEIPITLEFLDKIAVYHNDTKVSSDSYSIDTTNKKLILNGYSVADGDTIKIQNELNEVSASNVYTGTNQIARLGMKNNLKEFELFVDFPVSSDNIAIDGGAYNYQHRMFQIYTGSAISTTANTFTLKGIRDKGRWTFKINKDTTSNIKGAGYKKAIPEHDSERVFDANIFGKPVTNVRVTTSPTTAVFPQGTTFTLYGVEE